LLADLEVVKVRVIATIYLLSLVSACGSSDSLVSITSTETTSATPTVSLPSNLSYSADEIYWMELVNRARADPRAEELRIQAGSPSFNLESGLSAQLIARIGPTPPLAIHPLLVQLARNHSADMGARNYFAHTNPDGLTPFDRLRAVNYVGAGGENIYAGNGRGVSDAYRGWMNSAGHRANILDLYASYKDSGIGVALITSGTYGNYFTQVFGSSSSSAAHLLGVIFRDVNADNFYNSGEGVPGIRLDISKESSIDSIESSSTLEATGYFQIPLQPDTYHLKFVNVSTNAVVREESNIVMGTGNIRLSLKID